MLEVIVFSIPEALAVTLLACTLLGVRINWINVSLIAVIMGLMAYIFWTVIGLYLLLEVAYAAVLIILFYIFKMSPLWESVVSVVLAMTVYLIIEINIAIVMDLLNFGPSNLLNNTGGQFLCFLPQLFLTVLIALVLSKTKVNLFWDRNQGV